MLTIVTIQRLGPNATREEADRLAAFTVSGEPPGEITASIVAGEPVILGGLVKGGEYATVDEWLDSGSETLCIAADGRIVSTEDNEDALAAEARGALPIAWYTHEAP